MTIEDKTLDNQFLMCWESEAWDMRTPKEDKKILRLIKELRTARAELEKKREDKKVLIEFVLWASVCGEDETGPQPTHKVIGELATEALKKV